MATSEHDPDILERRSRGTRAVKRILHALLALTRAQQAAVEHAAESAARYSEWVEEVANEVLGAPQRAPGPALHVCFGPERAFCGALARETLMLLPSAGDLGLVGARFVEQARGHAAEGRIRFTLAGCTTPDDAKGVARSLAEALLKHGRGAQVYLHGPAQSEQSERTRLLIARLVRASCGV